MSLLRICPRQHRVPAWALLWTASWLISTGTAAAGDWPQILGPHRSGIADAERLATAWPADGPPVVWQRDVGRGYAGLAVAEGRAMLFHRIGNEEIAESLDPRSGKPFWKVSYPTHYSSGIAPDDGPRCVPLIHGGSVYLFGAGGDLHCADLATGNTRWSRGVNRDFGVREGYFGAGSSPILDGDRLLLNVGGVPGAGLAAFSAVDGKTLWQAFDEGASYSSPTATTIDGVRHIIFVTRLNVVSVDPATGTERFRFPFGKRGPTVNAATPLVFDDNLFVSASYGVGAALAKIGKDSASIVWASDDVMSSQYTTCVYKAGFLYGIDGRQDQGVASLRCFDPKTQKVQWTKDEFGTGNLILADDKLIILKTDGQLILADPSPERFIELATAQALPGTAQPLPALADGLLYVRDTKTLKCLDLRAAAK